jgi:hypothetical protein
VLLFPFLPPTTYSGSHLSEPPCVKSMSEQVK